MFWNDIAEIKAWMQSVSNSITELRVKLDLAIQENEDRGSVRQMIEDVLCSDDEYNTFNRLHDKLNHLLNDERRKEEVDLATATLDRFDDYMKNVHVLNAMINEFKGCVSLARGSLQERREIDRKDLEHNLAVMTAANILKDETRSKIDYIYENMPKIADFLQNCEKKSRKRRKPVKKKVASPAPLSE